MCHKSFSLELVHSLFIFRAKSVLIQLSVCNKVGTPDMQGTSSDECGCIHCEVAKVAEMVLLWPRMRLWLWKFPPGSDSSSCDSNGYVLFQRKFGVCIGNVERAEYIFG